MLKFSLHVPLRPEFIPFNWFLLDPFSNEFSNPEISKMHYIDRLRNTEKQLGSLERNPRARMRQKLALPIFFMITIK